MLRGSMLKRMGEKMLCQLFILTQVGSANVTSWWWGRRASKVGSTRAPGCLDFMFALLLIQATTIIPSAHQLHDVGRDRLPASQPTMKQRYA